MSAGRRPGRRGRSQIWTRAELRTFDRLRSPLEIQGLLDRLDYNTDDVVRAPRGALAARRVHCMDGALLAAAALERIGHPPVLIDLRAVRDDDHVLALYYERGRVGAVAKSNFVGLRFREPAYRTLRELVMSYFELYYNLAGEKTLRAYSVGVDLRRFDHLQWRTSDEAIPAVEEALNSARHYRLLRPAMERALRPVDRRSYEAGMHGTDLAGVYQPD